MSKLPGLKAPSKIIRPSGLVPPRHTPASNKALAPDLKQSLQPGDDFIIGDRVYVGGTKPGYIAYLGETQFAPGDWAGVVLDEAIGKNDGSVAGVRYFQCEPKRGVFSRPNKLTRTPDTSGAYTDLSAPVKKTTAPDSKLTPQTNGGSVMPTTHSNNATSKSVPKTSALVRRPALSTSTTSLNKEGLANATQGSGVSLKAGDRVLVSGTKPGTLRYIGLTDFAKGEWVGVELDDPLGKNDGAVAGKRYFNCQALFGLFAPVHKVTKISSSTSSGSLSSASVPSPRMVNSVSSPRTSLLNQTSPRMSSVASPRNTNMTASPRMTTSLSKSSRLSRDKSGSMESVSSVASSVSNTSRTRTPGTGVKRPSTLNVTATNSALQKALKEKDEHIDQLLKERDIDRSDVARASAGVEELERELTSLKSEHLRCLEEHTDSMDKLKNVLETHRKEKTELSAQLEDEKRKVEDLQFTIEEVEISKDDLIEKTEDNTFVKELEESKKEVEGLLKAEKKRSDDLQEELNTITVNYESKNNTLKESEDTSAAYLEQLEELTHNLSVAENRIKSLELSQTGSDSKASQISEVLTEKSTRINELEQTLFNHDRTSKDLQTKLSELQDEKDSQEKKMQKQQGVVDDLMGKLASRDTASSDLCTEIHELKSNSSEFQRQLASSEERVSFLTDDKNKLESQLSELMKHSGDSSLQLSLMNDQIQDKNRKLEELQANLSSATQKVRRLENTVETNQQEFEVNTETILSKHTEDLKSFQDRIDELNADLEKTSTKSVAAKAKYEGEMTKLTEMKNKEINDLQNHLQAKDTSIADSHEKCNSLMAQLAELTAQAQTWKRDKDKYVKQIDGLTGEKVDLQKESHVMKEERSKISAERETMVSSKASMEARVQQLTIERDKATEERLEALKIKEEIVMVKEKLSTEWETVIMEKTQMETALKEKSGKLSAIVGEVEKLRQEWANQKAHLDKAKKESQEEIDNIGELHTQLESLKKAVEEHQVQLRSVEGERNSLRGEVGRLQGVDKEKAKLISETGSLKDQLNEVLRREKQSLNDATLEKNQIQDSLKSLHVSMQHKEGEIELQQNEIKGLQGQLSLMSNYKSQLDNVEQDKKALEDRIFELEESLMEAQAEAVSININTNANSAPSQQTAGKDDSQIQIDFLNSVIVDMQKKNDEMKERLKAMENGVLNGNDDLSNNEPAANRRPAPRLFCDICDEFDLHDTDDCPTQDMSSSPQGSQFHGSRGEQRAYCDICEVFGHETSQCDDEQTF